MAAVASTSTAHLDRYLGRAADFVRPDFHQTNLDIEGFLKAERGFKLDSDEDICRLSLLPSGCPLPPGQCPYRHTDPSPHNFKPPAPLPSHPREREKKTTVCKHYLRNLCKMGDHCEYTHDFNLRTMPICHMFVKMGKCELGGECLYYHMRDRRVECPDYNRGFCVLGPECPRRHIRRVMCGAYMAGFCPDGKECKLAHPAAKRPDPEEYINPTPPNPDDFPGPPPQLPAGYGRWREYRHDPNATHSVVNPAWAEGGSLGGWRAGGFLSNSARRSDAMGDRYGGGGHGNDGGDGGSGPRRGGGGGGSGAGGGWVKDLSSILCFKCNQKGHFANACPNQAVPGDRGGLARRK